MWLGWGDKRRVHAFMLGRIFKRDGVLLAAGERARLVHERWLNRALADRTRSFPIIPTRRVADGGFAKLMATPEGRAWARQWWESALSRVHED